jgi:hypothetical protein
VPDSNSIGAEPLSPSGEVRHFWAHTVIVNHDSDELAEGLIADAQQLIERLFATIDDLRQQLAEATEENQRLMNLRLLKVLENELLAEAHEESARLAAHNGLLIEERDAALAAADNWKETAEEWSRINAGLHTQLVESERQRDQLTLLAVQSRNNRAEVQRLRDVLADIARPRGYGEQLSRKARAALGAKKEESG